MDESVEVGCVGDDGEEEEVSFCLELGRGESVLTVWAVSMRLPSIWISEVSHESYSEYIIIADQI